MIVSVWGSERRMEVVRSLLRKEHTCMAMEALFDFDLTKLDALILPMQGVQGEKGDYMDRAHIPVPKTFWECLREDCRIFSGRPTRFLESLSQPKSYYLSDERFLNENAALTAQGTLFYVLDHTNRILSKCSADIIGRGHCGQAIGALLSQLGVRVRYIRHGRAQGSDERTLSEWQQDDCADFVIHCVPYQLIEETAIEQWHHPTCVIDISGTLRSVEAHLSQKGHTYVRAANLPEQFAWNSSGEAIVGFIRRQLHV